jgi:hypothetical protein
VDDRAPQAPLEEPATTRLAQRPEKSSHRTTRGATKMPVLTGIPLAPRLYQVTEDITAGKLAKGEGSGDPARVNRRAPNITVSATNVLGGSTTLRYRERVRFLRDPRVALRRRTRPQLVEGKTGPNL